MRKTRIRRYKRRTKEGTRPVKAHWRNIDFPPRSKQANSIRIAIHVPSTIGDIPIPEEQFKDRIEETMRFLSKFGGYTKYKATGGWVNKDRLIKEKVAVVESYARVSDYKKLDLELKEFIFKKKKDWKQMSMAMQYQGKLYFF